MSTLKIERFIQLFIILTQWKLYFRGFNTMISAVKRSSCKWQLSLGSICTGPTWSLCGNTSCKLYFHFPNKPGLHFIIKQMCFGDRKQEAALLTPCGGVCPSA